MNCKKNANSNPGEERQLFHPESEKVVEIGLERLRPFKNHPFKVKEDEAMAQLMESIERYGILNPLIVMPTREGVYQIVSGHRRKYCAEKLGYTQVPVIIRYMKEEDSIISMVDSNLHRDKILFSEKAFAYYMKNEAMKRKTGKTKKNPGRTAGIHQGNQDDSADRKGNGGKSETGTQVYSSDFTGSGVTGYAG